MATQENRAMTSETSICNQALSWVGGTRITSLDDNGKYAEWCRNNYAIIRDAVLEERMWTFATGRVTLTTADMDEWGTLYKHSIPIDWLAVYRVYCDTNGNTSEGWKREGRFILSEDATIYVWGMKRIVDTGYFSSLFVQALAARLSAEMAVPLTGDHKKAAYHWKLYNDKLVAAAARDGQQGSNDYITQTRLTDARRR